MMKLEDFHYELPKEYIAQYPIPRGTERFMVVQRDTGVIVHDAFSMLIRHLRPGDCLVLNDTRVIPARLHGKKASGGKVEVLLLKEISPERWTCLVRSSKPTQPGSVLYFDQDLHATVEAKHDEGYELVFNKPELLRSIGEIPLPPYMSRQAGQSDCTDYQTIYAKVDGSVAAPTAGLHFTTEHLEALNAAGIELVYITLHVGIGTFMPVRCENILEHRMHAEEYELSAAAAQTLNRARKENRRIIAVGTTSTRVLEHLMHTYGEITAGVGQTSMFITPGYSFKAINGLLTNFHLPCSTLLMLTCAFGGYENIMAAYRNAVSERYRFFSYGDAMLII